MDKQFLFAKLEDNRIGLDIIEAMKKIPRELFISKELKDEAYGDYPLPTLSGQTISQPTAVALMLQYLELGKGMKVLEIGTGSGWNAAIISFIVGTKGRVISLEIREELIAFAKENIAKLKGSFIKNMKMIVADGSKGWKKEAPYDRIIVTAAAPQIYDEWKDQLKEDGILVAPIGTGYSQVMAKAVKKHGELFRQNMGHFQFVQMKVNQLNEE